MANPRRRTRALRYFGAGGWPDGLPETIFRATAKASATASLALASVVLALGGGPTGFPKQVSERCKAGGSWTPTAMANPRRRTRALRYFGAGGWPVGLPETIFRAKLPRQPWQTRAVARARSVILALGAGPTGFPKQFSARRPKSFCNSLSRARFRRFGAGGWPDGLPETSFRATQSGGILDADSHGKPAPSHARAPLFWRWGLARRVSRNNLPGEAAATAMANPRRRLRTLRYFGAVGWPVGLPETSFRATQSGGILEAAAAYAARSLCQWPQWPFFNEKRTNGQISSFGLRMADFILSRIRSLSAARPSPFFGRLAKRMATLSRPAAVLSKPMAFLSSFINGRFIKVEDQASGRNGRFIKQKRPNCEIC